ncbi:MAG: hypothetical protein V2J02_14115 [Pseudomonadales bacterium]|jgi:hypothetical protein|nr:hypothetical protein [Pseudomonadales bacterium]
MIRKITLAASVALLAGCGGGDINLTPTNIDNSVDNSTSTGGGGSNNPCANYQDPASNTLIQGTFDGTNCTYTSDFVGENNPLTVDLTIPFISGVHIFEDTLAIGESIDNTVASPPSVPQDGEGPTVTIRPGNTLAFLDSADYVLVNRGSRLVANGSPTAPITFTAFSDAVLGIAGPQDVSLWGGIQVNGNGITNNCSDTQRADGSCGVQTEGIPTFYGGDNNAESSGSLRYVVTKHSGFEVAPGDELNGITLNAVGSGTTIDHVEVYSTFDDGIEWFGGAVAVEKVVLLYVRDDSLDYSDGYVGSITDALVIQPLLDGNRCIEADNISDTRGGAGESLDTTPTTSPTVTGLTCIPSMIDENPGTHGDSEGVLLRLGARSSISNMVVYDGYGALANPATAAGNECLELDDGATRDAAQAGETTFTASVIACATPTQDSLGNGDTVAQFFTNTGTGTYDFNEVTFDDDGDAATADVTQANVIIGDANNANVSILATEDFRVAGYDPDLDVTTITIEDGSTVVFPGRLGAVSTEDDWTTGWTFGLNEGNRRIPLYFQTTP